MRACSHTVRHVHTQQWTCAHMHTHRGARTHTHSWIHTQIQTPLRMHAQTYAHTFAHAHTDTCTHMCTQIHTCTHTDTCAHRHGWCTHTHTHRCHHHGCCFCAVTVCAHGPSVPTADADSHVSWPSVPSQELSLDHWGMEHSNGPWQAPSCDWGLSLQRASVFFKRLPTQISTQGA